MIYSRPHECHFTISYSIFICNYPTQVTRIYLSIDLRTTADSPTECSTIHREGCNPPTECSTELSLQHTSSRSSLTTRARARHPNGKAHAKPDHPRRESNRGALATAPWAQSSEHYTRFAHATTTAALAGRRIASFTPRRRLAHALSARRAWAAAARASSAATPLRLAMDQRARPATHAMSKPK